MINILRYLDKVMGVVLTALLWYLQEYKGDETHTFTNYLSIYKYDIAYIGITITLLIAFMTSLYDRRKKHKAIDAWAKSLMKHIINQHLNGGDCKTRITIFKPQNGYKIILAYLFVYPIQAILMTNYKIKGQAFWTNVPYKLFSEYLTVYSRYCYSSNKKSYTHFKVSNRTEDTYNGIADKCFREQRDYGISTILIHHKELVKNYKNVNNRVKKYMTDSCIAPQYYSTLRSMNTIANNMYAIPIFHSNQKIWGVMIIDNKSDKKIDFSKVLEEYIAQYQSIFSFTIQILK